MKKISIAIVAIILLVISSCTKNSTGTNSLSANSWSFKNITYTTDSCTNSLDVLTASGHYVTAPTNSGDISLYFWGDSLPKTGGTFTVFKYNTTPANNREVTMVMHNQGVNYGTYYATGGNGSNESVQVTVSPSGKVSVTGTGIEMLSTSFPGDSAPLTLNISQTQ